MSERKQALREHFESQNAAAWPALQALRPADMTVEVYANEDGKWTVKDLLGHLADGERGNLGQARRLVAGKQTVPEDFDLDRWNRSAVRKTREIAPEELLDQIADAYQRALEFLETLDDADLDKVGRHASGVMMTTEEILRQMVDHRVEHTDDIQAALRR